VALFIAGQLNISNMIARAKWKTLNEVQTKIEKLQAAQDVPDKDTLERLAKLMDYHDRIVNTPNSALNFRSSLNFLNSLLLPVLAFLIGNLKDVIEFFQK
jgi:adenine-specific DNA methylase